MDPMDTSVSRRAGSTPTSQCLYPGRLSHSRRANTSHCKCGCEYNAAYHLLMQRECPSWLYPVTMGATTIWERWNSLLPDGSINPGDMTSFNHYALGAVADWLHRTVGGLAPAAAGYGHLDVQPHPGGGLTSARSQHLTPYGLAECTWTIEGEHIEVVVVVPPNATASITLPKGNGIPIQVGSGTYRWVYPYPAPAKPHTHSTARLMNSLTTQKPGTRS
jgi:alpha-L-rhamnosidase